MPRIVPAHCHNCKAKLKNDLCPNGCSDSPGWLEKQRKACVICYRQTNEIGECEYCGHED